MIPNKQTYPSLFRKNNREIYTLILILILPTLMVYNLVTLDFTQFAGSSYHRW